MTLNGVMAVFCVILATWVVFSAHCVQAVEDIEKSCCGQPCRVVKLFDHFSLTAKKVID